MKLFSLSLSVQISYLGEPEPPKPPLPPLSEGLSSDPLKGTAELLERYTERLNVTPALPGRTFFANGLQEGITLNHTVNVSAKDMREAQAILSRFYDLALSLTPEGQFELSERDHLKDPLREADREEEPKT